MKSVYGNRPSFVNRPRPGTVCVITEPTPAACRAVIRNGECNGATGFDLHLRVLEYQYQTEEVLKDLILGSYLPIMTLVYRDENNEHGMGGLSDEDLAATQILAAKCGVSACDIMGDFFDRGAENQFTEDEKAVSKQKRLVDDLHEKGAEVIMSTHIWKPMSSEQILEHMKKLEDRGADMIKIAYRINTEDEMIESMKSTVLLRRELKKPFIQIAMGQYGKLLRILSPILGSAITFCVNE